MIYAAAAFIIFGVALAGRALWKISRLPDDAPGTAIGPSLYLFIAGMAIAIVGAFVLVGQLLWRIFA